MPEIGTCPFVLIGLPYSARKTAVNENVIDVLIYIYENYMDGESQPPEDQGELEDELSQAGFTNGEIRKALLWLDELAAGLGTGDSHL